jgi:hypothetical protein
MLRAAGLAISALTNRPLEDAGSTSVTGDPVEDRKTAFKHHATEYFTLAKRVKTSLEAESGALQDESLIPQKGPGPRTGTGDDAVDNEGLGRFDIGWLNARTVDVAKRKEAEVWREVREMLETRQDGDANVTTGHSANGTNGH